ncbi:MAG: SpoIIE family protein phosphatase [Planctomycetota bacterium]|jgi:tetratricopeptide (TPR) repeat protein
MASTPDSTLDRARRVQLGMLPRTPTVEGLELHAHYAPCEEIGGDFYDVIALDDEHVALVMGDVVGHGIAAALLMASAKKSIQAHSHGRLSPAEVLGVVAEDLAPELLPGMFLTVLHVVLNVQTGAAMVARGGHIPLLHLRADGGGAVQIAPNGLPIGATPPALFREKTVEQPLQLAEGDQLVLMTDGLLEAQRGANELFGLERAADTLRGAALAPPEAVTGSLLDAVRGFSAEPIDDDVTVMTVRWRGRAVAPSEYPTNLTPIDSPPPGHESDHRALCELLRSGTTHVVALTGPVGAGKSALARVVGRALLPEFPGGSWLVDLRDAESSEGVAFAVARTFRLPLNRSNATVEAVGNLLRNRPPLLLVCDAFEQAAEHAAASIGVWRTIAPDVRFLIAARDAPELPGSVAHPLSPLAMPPATVSTLAELQRSPAAQLFLDHLRKAAGGMQFTDADAPALATVVRSVGGLPLALELGARRLAHEAGSQIETTPVPAETPDLRQALELTFQSLTAASRHGLQQLAIFRGGFTFDSAAAVLDPTIIPGPAAVLDVLQGLEAKSLIASSVGGRTARYAFRPGVQDFAAARWKAHAGPTAKNALVERFIQHCIDLGDAWGPRVRSPAAVEALDRLESETENFFAAYDLAFAAGDPVRAAQVILALAPSLKLRGPADQRAPRIDRARGSLAGRPQREAIQLRAMLSLGLSEAEHALTIAEELGDPVLTGQAHMAHSAALAELGRYGDAKTALDRAAAVPELLEHLPSRVDLLLHRGRIALYSGAGSSLGPLLEELEPHVVALGCPRATARLLTGRALVAVQQGRFEDACVFYEEAEAVYSEAGDPAGVAVVLGNLGNLHRQMRRYDTAHEFLSQAEHLDADLGNTMAVARHVANRASVFRWQERYEDAITTSGMALELQRATGDRRGEALTLDTRGNALLGLGRTEDARDAFRAGLELWDGVGVAAPTHRFALLTGLALAEQALGEANEARRHAAEAMEIAESHADTARDSSDPVVVEAWAALDRLLAKP